MEIKSFYELVTIDTLRAVCKVGSEDILNICIEIDFLENKDKIIGNAKLSTFKNYLKYEWENDESIVNIMEKLFNKADSLDSLKLDKDINYPLKLSDKGITLNDKIIINLSKEPINDSTVLIINKIEEE